MNSTKIKSATLPTAVYDLAEGVKGGLAILRGSPRMRTVMTIGAWISVGVILFSCACVIVAQRTMTVGATIERGSD